MDLFITGRYCYRVGYQGNYCCHAHVIIMQICVTVVSCSMFLKPEAGLLYFVLYKSSHVANAYKVAKQIVVSAPFVFLPAHSFHSIQVCHVVSCGVLMSLHNCAVASALESRLREPVFESCTAMSNLGQVFILHCSSSLSCVSENLVIDIGGYLCMNSLCALIAAWLDASQRS